MIRIFIILILSVMFMQDAFAKSHPIGAGAGSVKANVLIMLDTSGSMDWYVENIDTKYPMDVAFDSHGNIYIAKYLDTVQKHDSTGKYLMQWGEYDGTSANGKFDYTYAIDVDSHDNVYVSDYGHARVQKFDSNGNYLNKYQLSTSAVKGVALDSSNNVYAIDNNGRVEKFDNSGTKLATWTNSGAEHISIDSSNNVYVTNYTGKKIEKYNTSGTLQSSFSVSFKPFGIEADGSGNLYISDINSSMVYKYTTAGVYVNRWGGNGTSALKFKSPKGIGIDSHNTAQIADYNNNRVKDVNGNLLLSTVAPEKKSEQAARVIKQIVSNSDLTGSANFGLISWSTTATLRVPISSSGASQIYNTIDSLYIGGGTILDSAMNLANSYLTGNTSPIVPGASCQVNIIIVVSDGIWEDYTASKTAENLYENLGIKTFVAGFMTTGGDTYVILSQAGGTYPDSPLYTNNWQQLYETLTSYIQQAIISQLTFTAPTVIPGTEAGDHILQSTFTYKQSHQWKGHLIKYSLDSNGNVGSAVWDAGTKLANTSSSSRNIWTVSTGMPSSLNNFTTDNIGRLRNPMEENSGKSYTDDELGSLINYVRGIDSYGEFSNGLDDEGDAIITGERWKLGDIYHSKVIAVGAPSAYVSADANTNSEAYYRYINGYNTFKSSSQCGTVCSSRREIIYAGANDGMLHAFDSSTGEEIWAFIPPSILPNFKDIISNYTGKSNSIYGVDSSPTVKDVYYNGAWHTILISGVGQGGESYFALDVTNPDSPSHLFTFAHNVITNTVSYWDSSGTRTDYNLATTTPPDQYNFSKLGESWSQPVIFNLKNGDTKTWVAAFGGGFNGAINPNYGAKLYVINLEDGGKIIKNMDIPDEDSSDSIINSVPPRVTAITSDSTTYFSDAGALIYFTDLEGKLWKINMTGTGTLYETTKLFDTEANYSSNERLSYHENAASVLSDGSLMQYFGTGDMQRLDDTSSTIANRFFAIRDMSFPQFSSTTAKNSSSLTNMTGHTGTCPTTSDYGWYINLNSKEKVTAKATVKNDIVLVPRYTPDSANVCQSGTSMISELNYLCGSDIRDTNLGYGVATEAVIYKNKIYIGVSSDAPDSEGSLPEGFQKVGNLIVGTPATNVTGKVTIERWWEDFVNSITD